ncbi:MAG: hypothetical protein OXE99_14285 [Cellvibrionales bacterium]|nr:hypothetical protein [Cellvibrionales bacterium]
MNKILIPSLICAALLTACGGDSDSGNSQKQSGGNNNDNNPLPGPAVTSVAVSGSKTFDQEGKLQLTLAMIEIKGDEAVFYKSSGEALDKNEVKVTPSHSVLYPTNGKLNLNVEVEDKGVEQAQTISFNFTTADGQEYTVSTEVE